MCKRDLFIKKFGFQLDDLLPISLYHDNEIKYSITKSPDAYDYYTNYNKIDLYIYSYKSDSWSFIANGVKK